MVNTNVRGTAYHEAAQAVVACALGLEVRQIYICDDDESGGTEISTDQTHLPIEDRIAVCVAGIAAKPIFAFTMSSSAERADVALMAALLINVDEKLHPHLKEAGHRRAEGLLKANRLKVHQLAQYLITNRAIEAGLIHRLLDCISSA
jgi:ATP-dependent Zn protease